MGNIQFQERKADQENKQHSDCTQTVNDELTNYKCSNIVLQRRKKCLRFISAENQEIFF